jgi:hypothetical protein
MNHPEDRYGDQLWEPFVTISLNSTSIVEGVSGERFIKAVKKYYLRISIDVSSIDFSNIEVTLASRLLKNSTVFSSLKYRRFRNETSRGNHHVFFSALDNRYVLIFKWK